MLYSDSILQIKQIRSLLFLLPLLLLTASPLEAQRQVTRDLIINPLLDDRHHLGSPDSPLFRAV